MTAIKATPSRRSTWRYGSTLPQAVRKHNDCHHRTAGSDHALVEGEPAPRYTEHTVIPGKPLRQDRPRRLAMGSEHSKTERLNTECAPTIRGRCMCGDICYEITGP